MCGVRMFVSPMQRSVFQRWSSVRMKRMLGRFGGVELAANKPTAPKISTAAMATALKCRSKVNTTFMLCALVLQHGASYFLPQFQIYCKFALAWSDRTARRPRDDRRAFATVLAVARRTRSAGVLACGFGRRFAARIQPRARTSQPRRLQYKSCGELRASDAHPSFPPF